MFAPDRPAAPLSAPAIDPGIARFFLSRLNHLRAELDCFEEIVNQYLFPTSPLALTSPPATEASSGLTSPNAAVLSHSWEVNDVAWTVPAPTDSASSNATLAEAIGDSLGNDSSTSALSSPSITQPPFKQLENPSGLKSIPNDATEPTPSKGLSLTKMVPDRTHPELADLTSPPQPFAKKKKGKKLKKKNKVATEKQSSQPASPDEDKEFDAFCDEFMKCSPSADQATGQSTATNSGLPPASAPDTSNPSACNGHNSAQLYSSAAHLISTTGVPVYYEVEQIQRACINNMDMYNVRFGPRIVDKNLPFTDANMPVQFWMPLRSFTLLHRLP